MLSKLSLMTATVSAAATFNYETNGADWGDTNPECLYTNQSPIDLPEWDPDNEDDFPYKVYSSNDDDYRKSYSNQAGSVFTMTGYTGQVDLAPEDGLN